MDERLFNVMGERLLTTEARLEILEAAFISLVSLDRKTAEAIETVLQAAGENQLMASDEKGQLQRQNLAAVRLGKNLEAAVARRYGHEG